MAKRRNIQTSGLAGLLALAGLAGCVPAPLPPPEPLPLVAIPGPGKTEDAFRQDDAVCRADEATAAPAAAPAPPAQGTPAPPPADAASPPPLDAYFRCMTAHNDVVQPVTLAHPLPYGYYDAYAFPGGPFYPGYDPFFYGGYFGVGLYGGYGRYGYRYGGYRGGFRGGGYHGGFAHGGRH